MKSTLEFTTKISPLILGMVTVLGFAKVNFYYSVFNIDIINYLVLSEIPLLFLEDLLAGFLIIVIFTLVCFIVFRIRPKDENTEGNLFHSEIKKISVKEWASMTIPVLFSTLSISLSLAGIVKENGLIFLLYPASLVLSALLIVVINRFIKNLYRESERKSYLLTVMITWAILSCVCLTLAESKVIAYQLKTGEIKGKIISFDYIGKSIRTNNNEVYIGETMNNLFIYNRNIKETTIFLRSNIDNFKILESVEKELKKEKDGNTTGGRSKLRPGSKSTNGRAEQPPPT
ncbi:MAG: hypothetical protein HRT71_13150 [Flavobacteriales bacterium]|nr:hypothetical protein [Flavobacteriales bacterium]